MNQKPFVAHDVLTVKDARVKHCKESSVGKFGTYLFRVMNIMDKKVHFMHKGRNFPK